MLDVLLVSPEKVIFEGKASSLTLPGEEGVFEVLSYHRPLLSRLITGKILIDNTLYNIRRGLWVLMQTRLLLLLKNR